jgi:hypothetical protein
VLLDIPLQFEPGIAGARDEHASRMVEGGSDTSKELHIRSSTGVLARLTVQALNGCVRVDHDVAVLAPEDIEKLRLAMINPNDTV